MKDNTALKILLSILSILTILLGLTAFLVGSLEANKDTSGYLVCGIFNSILSALFISYIIIVNIYEYRQLQKVKQLHDKIIGKTKHE